MSDGRLSAADWRAHFADPAVFPAASKLLGFELIDLDPEAGWVECAFLARADFLNPGGTVQGGFLTAMLDDAMSIAGVISMGQRGWVPTLQMTTSFLSPAREGRLIARGEVARAGRSAIHTSGHLRDGEGRLIATAVAACIPRPLPG